MKPRHLLLLAALLLAAGFAFFGDKRPDGLVEAAPRSAAAPALVPARAQQRTNPDASKPAMALAILRLEPRETLMADGTMPGVAAHAFASHNWTPPAPPAPPPAPFVPPVPTAPPLPFTYLGKAAANGEWEVFLARGDQTVVARRALVIDGAYRVDAVAPPIVTFTYLPLNQIQQLNIGVSD